jgi:RNA polymerase sigma-70 factor (sigma-E family)
LIQRDLFASPIVYTMTKRRSPVLGVEVAEKERPRAAKVAEIYARHAPAAAEMAYLLTGDRHLAEDLTQEAFIRVAGRFHHLRNPEAFGAYLRRAIINLFLTHIRRRNLERDRWAKLGAASRGEALMPDVAQRDEVWRALTNLPPRQRAALVLRYYEDLSEGEIAGTMGCSAAAVKALVGRGLQTLRSEMTEDSP